MLLKIEAYHDGEFWCARAIGEDIFTQGQTMDELIENIKEAVALHYEETDILPEIVPMHPAIAKGTLNDILTSVSLWIGISKDELIDEL